MRNAKGGPRGSPFFFLPIFCQTSAKARSASQTQSATSAPIPAELYVLTTGFRGDAADFRGGLAGGKKAARRNKERLTPSDVDGRAESRSMSAAACDAMVRQARHDDASG